LPNIDSKTTTALIAGPLPVRGERAAGA